MSTEDRLRRAITDRTDHVEPAPDGLTTIEETLMAPTPMSPRNKWVLGGAAAVFVTLVAVAAVALRDDDSPQGVATDPSVSTTVGPQVTTTEAPPNTATTTLPPTSEPTSAGDPTSEPTSPSQPTPTTGPAAPPPRVVQAASVVWPRPGHVARFDDPVAAARSFAVFYAGFTNPTIGPFMSGDSRSGEVEVRPEADAYAPVTSVLVRQMADDHWYVIGSTTPDIVIDDLGPKGNGVIACPGTVRVAGSALAFEGNVGIRIDSFGLDGSRTEIGRGFGTGAGTPPAAPFQADVDCDAPFESWRVSDVGGVVMVWEDSARDGHRRAVAARPVSFIR